MKRRQLFHSIAALGVAFVAVFASACATDDPLGPGLKDPTVRLDDLLNEWWAPREEGGTCASGGGKYPYVDCGRVQAEIERLVLEFPNHPDVLLANAVIAFETRQPEKALDYLDSLMELEHIEPGVTVLRSRIAIDQGNLPYARRLLEAQAHMAPDAPDIREALAAVHYLSGEYDASHRELIIAERLGAPAWRIAFNRGLIEEAQENFGAAMEQYRLALDENPEYEPARSRLRGLESTRGL